VVGRSGQEKAPPELAPRGLDHYSDQEHLLEKQGQRMPVEDGYIAATARRHGLTIVTGNDKDFRRPGLKVFNPFKELPSV
jgi:predicted nucleic acid-binding protein